MESTEKYRLYLRDLVYLLKEQQFELNSESNNDAFQSGIQFSYTSILDLIESQAEAFNIELSEIGYDDFEKFKNRP
jgi:hypothetical protein